MEKRDDHTDANWLRLRSEEGPDLKLFKVRFDHMRNARNGQIGRMVVLEAPDSVNVVALAEDGQLLLSKQYRFGTEEMTLECPGGIVDPGEAHRTAAERELREETGYSSTQWRYLGCVPSNPVFMDNYCHHWLALGATATHALDLDAEEAIEPFLLPLSELKAAVKAQQISHPHTLSALARVFELWDRPDLTTL